MKKIYVYLFSLLSLAAIIDASQKPNKPNLQLQTYWLEAAKRGQVDKGNNQNRFECLAPDSPDRQQAQNKKTQ